jgi:hypothetical protein
MKDTKDPLAWWDSSGTRRAIAISFLVGVFFGFLAVFPAVSEYYDQHPVLRNVAGCAVAALGLLLALLELKHSGEANEHRVEQNRLTREANEFRDKANEYHAEANRLGDKNNELKEKTLELQIRVHGLQENIEKKLTKIRLYARAHADGPKVQLLVSNLSEFDLWINQVELIVTEGGRTSPATRTLGGARRISRGHAEDGYNLQGALISINGDRTDRLRMKFHIKVVVTGVDDGSVTVKSPDYDLTLEHGGPPELNVLKY